MKKLDRIERQIDHLTERDYITGPEFRDLLKHQLYMSELPRITKQIRQVNCKINLLKFKHHKAIRDNEIQMHKLNQFIKDLDELIASDEPIDNDLMEKVREEDFRLRSFVVLINQIKQKVLVLNKR